MIKGEVTSPLKKEPIGLALLLHNNSNLKEIWAPTNWLSSRGKTQAGRTQGMWVKIELVMLLLPQCSNCTRAKQFKHLRPIKEIINQCPPWEQQQQPQGMGQLLIPLIQTSHSSSSQLLLMLQSSFSAQSVVSNDPAHTTAPRRVGCLSREVAQQGAQEALQPLLISVVLKFLSKSILRSKLCRIQPHWTCPNPLKKRKVCLHRWVQTGSLPLGMREKALEEQLLTGRHF